MGRKRTPIKPTPPTGNGTIYLARFFHPVLKRSVGFSLGDVEAVKANLDSLNRVFLDPALWFDPPAKIITEHIRQQWMGPDGITKLVGDAFKDGGKVSKATAKETVQLIAQNKALTLKVEELLKKIETQARELEHWRGKKTRRGPCPTLSDAIKTWLSRYKGRDADATKTIEWDLARFCKRFDGSTPIDKLEGREQEINAWIRGLMTKPVVRKIGKVKKIIKPARPISASRRMSIRLYVIKMLVESGALIDRKAIERVTKKQIRRDRGAIKWLTQAQAQDIAGKLPSPWQEAFKIQVAIGLRPDEMLTLQRKNFNNDFTSLTLEPLNHLTLKTGSRKSPIPAVIKSIVESRLESNDVLFPDPESKRPWRDPKAFNRRYKRQLVKAAKAAAVAVAMDSRIGRRTCASLLLQSNVSAEKIAALLGNTPSMILEHYGDPDVEKIDLKATTLTT